MDANSERRGFGPSAEVNSRLHGAPLTVTPANAKRFSTAAARAALVGATLTPTESDTGRTTFVLTWHHVTREFRRLEEVERVLDVMGDAP
jgi:hypothetical protein